jgi:hypothetical protein
MVIPLKDGDLVQRTEVVYELLGHFQLKPMDFAIGIVKRV